MCAEWLAQNDHLDDYLVTFLIPLARYSVRLDGVWAHINLRRLKFKSIRLIPTCLRTLILYRYTEWSWSDSGVVHCVWVTQRTHADLILCDIAVILSVVVLFDRLVVSDRVFRTGKAVPQNLVVWKAAARTCAGSSHNPEQCSEGSGTPRTTRPNRAIQATQLCKSE